MKNTLTYPVRRRRFALVLALPLALAINLAAQTDGALATDEPEDGEVVRLSPFDVTGEEPKGYMASNTMSGTALNMQLKDVPMAINVITSEFLQDAGLTELVRVFDYSTSITQAGRPDVRPRGSLFTIRGFRTRNVLLDGVSIGDYVPADLIDRVEVVKGPNTLYGQSDPGGLINIISKRPRTKNEAELTAAYGSWNTFKTGVDVNRVLSDQLTVRVAGSYQSTDGWHVVDGLDSKFGAGMVDWKPLPDTKVQLTYSYNTDEGSPASRSTSPFMVVPTDLNGDGDKTDTVNGVPEANTRYNNDFVPWRWTSEAEKNRTERNTEFVRAAVTQSLGEHIDAQYQYIRSTQNMRNNFRGFNTFNAAGSAPADYTFERYYSLTTAHSLNLNGRFDNGRIKHSVVGGIRYTEDTDGNLSLGLRPTGSATELARLNQLSADTGRTFRRAYTRTDLQNNVDIWSEDVPTIADFYKYGTYFNPSSGGILAGENPTSYTDVTTYYLSDSISMLDERLRVLLGVRSIEISEYTHNFDGTTQLLADGSAERTSRDTSYQIGANYRINDHLVPFANYATAFNPNGYDAANNKFYEAERSKAWEAGFKFDAFLDGRVSGTVSYFSITKSNVVRSNYTPGPPPANITEISDDQSQGLDAELFIDLTPQWQVMLGYTYMDAKTIKSTTTALGLALEGAAPQKYSVWTSYSVESGPLKGLRFGGGVFQAVGKIQQFGTSNFRMHYQDGFYEVAAFVRYETKISDHDVSFALNGNNLTDQQYYRSRGDLNDPRSVTFSVGLEF